MKVSKTGEVKCEKGEVRVGNFFVKLESGGMVKLTDLSSQFVHRISVDVPIGALLSSAVEQILSDGGSMSMPAREFIHGYCSMMWLCSSVVPVVRKNDAGEVEYNFWDEIFRVLSRAADEAKAVYGVKGALSDEDDADALESVRDAVELEKEIREMEG